MYWFAKVVITNYCRLGGLNNRIYVFRVLEEVQDQLAGLIFSEVCLLSLKTATLCVLTWPHLPRCTSLGSL